MEILNFEDEGDYKVVTTSGTMYLVSLEKISGSTLTRVIDPENEDSIRMRKGTKTLPLLGMFQCQVGLSAVFLIYGVADDPTTFTQRITTKVVEITKLS
jgi:hypothetical protein